MSEGGAILRAKGLADPRKHDQRGACSFGLLPDRPDCNADDRTDEGHTRYELDGANDRRGANHAAADWLTRRRSR